MDYLMEQQETLDRAAELNARRNGYSDVEEQDLRPLHERFPAQYDAAEADCVKCGERFQTSSNRYSDAGTVAVVCPNCVGGTNR